MVSAVEYLTKQVVIEKEIVTYRLLSRVLSIHANVAKNELALFHASSQATDEPVHATFLLIGEVAPISAYGSYRDETQMEVDGDEPEMVSTTKILLVNEDGLEAAKIKFVQPPSVHIYSLSPSPIKDAALLIPVADRIRSQYGDRGKEFHERVGVVISADVKLNTLASKKPKANVATSSKLLLPDKKTAEKPKSAESVAEQAKVQEKKTKTGTLDWSKAKSKAEKEKEANAAKEAARAAKKEKAAAKEKEKEEKETEKAMAKAKAVAKKESKMDLKKGNDVKAAVKKESEEPDVSVKKEKVSEKPKRGKKRPSAVLSLSDSESEGQDSNPAPKTKPRTSTSSISSKPASASEKHIRVKKGVLISDDEDNAVDTKPKLSRQNGKGKGRAVVSDDEDGADRSVKAMMDLDDSHFTRHNVKPAEELEEKAEEEEDFEMLSDSEPIPARVKPKRKPKKKIPVGSNGLPKKRIVKSKRSKDARGYMVTVDYSSYESASESEQVPEAPKKHKKPRKAAKEDPASRSASEKPTTSKAQQPNSKPSNVSTTENKMSSAEKSSLKQTQADVETKTEATKLGPVSGESSKSNNAKLGIGNKNIMSYFGKK